MLKKINLKNKTALVTGAGKGIGKACAIALAEAGAKVIILSRTKSDLDKVTKIIKKTKGSSKPYVCDVTQYEEFKKILQKINRLDILVNNAAVVGGQVRGTLAEADEIDLSQDLDTKVVGYFRCIKEVAPYMQSQKSGRIINIGGLSARQSSIYGLRNAAVSHLTKTLSDQLGTDGITVNVIHPGGTRTEDVDRGLEQRATRQGISVEELVAKNTQGVAIKRNIFPSELAYLVAFLASPKAECITGESIAAGGGAMGAVFQ